MPTAPPQWASASHENGFSYLSWKRKAFLAAAVVGCGFGLAALFPNNTASGDLAAAPSNSAQTEQADQDAEASPVFSQPQSRYASNAQATKEGDGPFLAEPNAQITRYTEPPAISKGNEPRNSPDPQSLPVRSTRRFEPIDDSAFKPTALDLPLARWNPLFDRPPPLSEHPLQPLVDDSALVPAQGETVQAMKVHTVIDENALVPVRPEAVHTLKATPEPLIHTIIDFSQLVPAEDYEVTVLIPEESIIPADQDVSP